jgi:hypothetical protein
MIAGIRVKRKEETAGGENVLAKGTFWAHASRGRR